MSAPTVGCPLEGCHATLALTVGTITGHLVDEHGYTKIGAQAAENVLRREAAGWSAPTPRPAPKRPRTGQPHHCSVCGRPGTRRDYCPDAATHPEGAPLARARRAGQVVKANSQTSPFQEQNATSAGVDYRQQTVDAPARKARQARSRSLLRVGKLIDNLRDAADELDELVAAGAIA